MPLDDLIEREMTHVRVPGELPRSIARSRSRDQRRLGAPDNGRRRRTPTRPTGNGSPLAGPTIVCCSAMFPPTPTQVRSCLTRTVHQPGRGTRAAGDHASGGRPNSSRSAHSPRGTSSSSRCPPPRPAPPPPPLEAIADSNSRLSCASVIVACAAASLIWSSATLLRLPRSSTAQVVTRVVRLAGHAAVDRRLLRGLDALRAGEQATRRDAGEDERAVVGAAVERRSAPSRVPGARNSPGTASSIVADPAGPARPAAQSDSRRRTRTARSSASRPCRSSAIAAILSRSACGRLST